PERLLDGVELVPVGHALDGREAAAVGLDGEHRAALHRLAIHVDRAGTALARIAADVSSGKAGYVADVVHEPQPRLRLLLVLAPVDGYGDLVLHRLPPQLAGRCAGCAAGPSVATRAPFRTVSNPSIRLLLALKCNWKIRSRSARLPIGCSRTCWTSTRSSG